MFTFLTAVKNFMLLTAEGAADYITDVVQAVQGAGIENVLDGVVALIPILVPLGVGFVCIRKMLSFVWSTIANA